MFPKEIPSNGTASRRTNRQWPGAGGIGSEINRPPVLRTLKCDDGVDFPTFQSLSVTFLAGYCIGERNRKAMTNIKITVCVFAAQVIGILRQTCPIAKIPVRTHVIERVR